MSAVTISGYVCGLRERAYDGFTDQAGETRPGGITRRIWVADEEALDAPHEVKLDELALGHIKKAGPFCHVTLRVSLGRTLSLLEVVSVTPASGEVVAASA